MLQFEIANLQLSIVNCFSSSGCDGGMRRFERRGWGSIPHGDILVSGEW